MERIRITPTTEYFFKGENGKQYNLTEIRNSYTTQHGNYMSNIGNVHLYIKNGKDCIEYKNITQYKINYKSIQEYKLDEIIAFQKLGDFTFSKNSYDQCNDRLTQPIHITGPVIFEIQKKSGSLHDDDMISRSRLLELYSFILNSKPKFPIYIFYNDKRYSVGNINVWNGGGIIDIDIYINGKYILDHTYEELSIIERSNNYIISPSSIVGDIIVQNVLTPVGNILDYVSCSVKDDNSLTIEPKKDDQYPCNNGVLQLVISHFKINLLIVDRNINNFIELYKELLKLGITILTK